MGQFFVDTSTGHVATLTQLSAAGFDDPQPPWHRIQGPVDATTLWQAVMVKAERGIFIGTLTLRHGDHHALLMRQGWREVPPPEIGVSLPGSADQSELSPSPWSE